MPWLLLEPYCTKYKPGLNFDIRKAKSIQQYPWGLQTLYINKVWEHEILLRIQVKSTNRGIVSHFLSELKSCLLLRCFLWALSDPTCMQSNE
jgi:hypothetical protein